MDSQRPLLTLTSAPWTCWAGSWVHRWQALTPLVRPVQEDFLWSVAESAAVRGPEATAVLPGPGASRPPLGSIEEWAVKRLLVGLWWVWPGVRSRAGFCSPPGPRGPIGSRRSLHLCSHTELWTGRELVGASLLPVTSSHPQAQAAARVERPRPLGSPGVLAAVLCTLTCASSRSPGLCGAGSGGHWLVEAQHVGCGVTLHHIC